MTNRRALFFGDNLDNKSGSWVADGTVGERSLAETAIGGITIDAVDAALTESATATQRTLGTIPSIAKINETDWVTNAVDQVMRLAGRQIYGADETGMKIHTTSDSLAPYSGGSNARIAASLRGTFVDLRRDLASGDDPGRVAARITPTIASAADAWPSSDRTGAAASSAPISEEPSSGLGVPAPPAGSDASGVLNEAQSAAAAGSGLVIYLVYEANALAAPQSFRDGMQTAVNLLEAAIHDNVTVNIDVSYGTFGNVLLPNQNTSEGNIGYTGNGTNGVGITESYANLRTLLFDSATSAVDAESVAVLPNTTSLQGRSSFTIGTAQAKALGVFPASASTIDGQVGIGTAFTGNVLVSAALHEITHAMGRINGDSLDLFRYSSPGIHLFGEGTPAPPAYFSIDGGITDLADFGINSDPGDFLNPPGSNRTANDPFDEIVGNLGALTSVDLREMDVLGFNVTTSPTSPTPSPDLPWQTDGTSIFLQSDSGPAAIWTVSGTAFAGGGIVGNPGPSWHAKAPGDFNGDGRPDFLWQNDSGEVAIWELNGTAVVGGGSLGNPGPSWQVGSVGDFNGDGRSDILWRNSSGDVAIWEMNGTSVISSGGLGNPGASWRAVGTGDFNGDRKSDILWQNDSGQIAIWEMNGTGVLGGGGVANPGPSWHAKGTGDFNGDGRADILFQNDSGQVAIWEMSGTAIIGGGNVANPGPDWHAMGVGDYNSDGRSDILLQSSSGDVAIWEMNGTGIIGGGSIANPGPTWHV